MDRFSCRLIFFFIFLIFSINVSAQKYELELGLIETTLCKLDSDEIPDTIKVYKYKGWADPGDVHKLEILLSNGKPYIVEDVDAAYIAHGKEFTVPNLSESEYVYVNKTSDISYVFLFGYTFASTPGRFTVLKIANDKVSQIFNEDFEVKDIYQTSALLVVGRKYYEQSTGDIKYEIRTYAPYSVYICSDVFLLDINLTVKYNEKNYVGYLSLDKSFHRNVIFEKGKEPVLHLTTYRRYPEVSLAKLKSPDLEKYSLQELRLMRNEIYADYGYIFISEDLKKYFENQDWYKPTDSDISSKLTDIEIANVKLIKAEEAIRKGKTD